MKMGVIFFYFLELGKGISDNPAHIGWVAPF